MRFFDEETAGKGSVETIIIIKNDEAKTIVLALTDFVKANKRSIKAKKVLNDINEKWNIF